MTRLTPDQHRQLTEQRRHLGEGIFPPGSQERQIVVGIVWWAVRDYFDGDTEALEWLRGQEAEELLRWIGLPQAAFVARIREVAADPEQRKSLGSRFFAHDRARVLIGALA